MKQTIINEFNSHLKTINNVINNMEDQLVEASLLAVETLKNGNKILLCGNGGSAADAQHIAAELTGRYKTERRGLPGIALTTDTSALTAIGNDYGYGCIDSHLHTNFPSISRFFGYGSTSIWNDINDEFRFRLMYTSSGRMSFCWLRNWKSSN